MYFIVNTTYDDCFKHFFQDVLGYPSFYRMNELLPLHEVSHLVLLVPYDPKNHLNITKIDERIQSLGLKSYAFGQDLETEFVFDQNGQIQLKPLFKQALELALTEFIKQDDEPKPNVSAA